MPQTSRKPLSTTLSADTIPKITHSISRRPGKVNGENGCPEKSSRRGRTDGRAMAMSAEQRGALELLAGHDGARLRDRGAARLGARRTGNRGPHIAPAASHSFLAGHRPATPLLGRRRARITSTSHASPKRIVSATQSKPIDQTRKRSHVVPMPRRRPPHIAVIKSP
jgi:hypothetical protein